MTSEPPFIIGHSAMTSNRPIMVVDVMMHGGLQNQGIYWIYEFVYFVWGLSSRKRRVVRWRNFARRRVL